MHRVYGKTDPKLFVALRIEAIALHVCWQRFIYGDTRFRWRQNRINASSSGKRKMFCVHAFGVNRRTMLTSAPWQMNQEHRIESQIFGATRLKCKNINSRCEIRPVVWRRWVSSVLCSMHKKQRRRDANEKEIFIIIIIYIEFMMWARVCECQSVYSAVCCQKREKQFSQ